ncbi:MAG: EpsI family protein [Candidatus Krumholzibacteria bacterium]|nr:EpsI family protein [Candidatus Krumholzibacteria bacterium]
MDASSTKRIAAVAVVTAALCAYTWALRLREAPAPTPPRWDRIPAAAAGYAGRDEMIPPWSLAELGADTTFARAYVDPSGERIELFIGYFSAQQERSQIHSPKHCYPGSGWDILSEGSLMLRLPGRAERARRLVISDGIESRLVVYWFAMGGRVISNEFALKWSQMTSALLGRQQSAAFVRFSIGLEAGREDEARRRLAAFIERIAPGVIDAFGQPERGEQEG